MIEMSRVNSFKLEDNILKYETGDGVYSLNLLESHSSKFFGPLPLYHFLLWELYEMEKEDNKYSRVETLKDKEEIECWGKILERFRFIKKEKSIKCQ